MNDENEKKLSDAQISKAVDFWKQQLQSGVWDNGDRSSTGAMTSFIARDLQEKCRPTEEEVEKFGVALTTLLQGRDLFWGGLAVDYHPCSILRDAADAAGINSNAFPCKTDLAFRDGKVKVSCGYGAPWETL